MVEIKLKRGIHYAIASAILLAFIVTGCKSSPETREQLEDPEFGYEIILDTLLRSYTDSTSWFYPSVGVVHQDGSPSMLVLTIQQWLTGKSDVFTPVVSGYSMDGGQSWSEPDDPNNAFAFIPGDDGFETGMCNFTVKWHQKSETLLGTCHSVPYQDKKLIRGERSPVWATFDPTIRQWNK